VHAVGSDCCAPPRPLFAPDRAAECSLPQAVVLRKRYAHTLHDPAHVCRSYPAFAANLLAGVSNSDRRTHSFVDLLAVASCCLAFSAVLCSLVPTSFANAPAAPDANRLGFGSSSCCGLLAPLGRWRPPVLPVEPVSSAQLVRMSVCSAARNGVPCAFGRADLALRTPSHHFSFFALLRLPLSLSVPSEKFLTSHTAAKQKNTTHNSTNAPTSQESVVPALWLMFPLCEADAVRVSGFSEQNASCTEGF